MGKDDLEKAVIGCIIGHNSALPSETGLSKEDFSDRTNRSVFSALEELEKEGTDIDLVSLHAKLKSSGVEGWDNKTLIGMVDSVLSSISFPSYLKQLKDYRRRQSLSSIASEIEMHSSTGKIDNDTIFSIAEKILSNVSSDSSKYGINSENVDSFYEYIESMKGKDLFGYSFGPAFGMLDRATKGIQPGRTYRIGAPSNLGKTQFVYNIINALVAQGAKVAFFALENDRDFTITNLMANYMQVNSHKITKGSVDIDAEYFERIQDKLYIVDGLYELSEIFAQTMEIKPDVVILDYIGLVNIKKFPGDAMYEEYAKQVQRFVKKTRVGWIDLSNLAKGQEDSETIRLFGGFYGSSFLKNNADVGIHMMYYDAFYEYKKRMDEHKPGSPLSTHQQRMSEDMAYRIAWESTKGVTMFISKNRIGTARLEENYTINFDAGARFKVIDGELKNKIDNWI